MFLGKKIVALIPARSGSKGIIDKNLSDLGGQPLVSWPILVALNSEVVDEVIVSTDSPQIAEVARKFGASVAMRSPELALDSSKIVDTIRNLYEERHCRDKPETIYVLLEPTSPLRTSEDIDICVARMEAEKLDSIASFVSAHTNPHRAWVIEDGIPKTFIPNVVPWLPRQELPQAYQLTGQIYAFRPGVLPREGSSILFGKIGAYQVDPKTSVDIDSEIDLILANALFQSHSISSLK